MDLETHIMPKLVRAIYDIHTRRREDTHRPHLGGSQIGNPCSRALWYQFRHADRATFDGRMLRLFDTGHREEARLIEELKAIPGVTVWDVDPDTGKQIRFTDCDGHFALSLDGVIQGIPESTQPHTLEIKTMNRKAFDVIKKDGLQKSKPVYWVQCQIGMHKAELDRCLFLAVCKDTDEIYMERVKYDPAEGMQLIAKAERIIFSDTPPAKISDDPSFYLCKFCDFWNVCHAQQPPLVNCRTCAHSTPERGADGKWSCALGREMTPCEKHLFNPHLMGYEVADAGEDWVEYVMPDTGEVIRNHGGNSQSIRDAWIPF